MSSVRSEPRAKGLAASAAPAVEVAWGTAYELVLGLRMFVDHGRGPGLVHGRRGLVRRHARRALRRDARRDRTLLGRPRDPLRLPARARCGHGRAARRRRVPRHARAHVAPRSSPAAPRPPSRDLSRRGLARHDRRGRRRRRHRRRALLLEGCAGLAASAVRARALARRRRGEGAARSRVPGLARSRPPSGRAGNRPGAEAKRPGGERPRGPPRAGGADRHADARNPLRARARASAASCSSRTSSAGRGRSSRSRAGRRSSATASRRRRRHRRRAARPARRRVQGARRRDAPAHPAPARGGPGLASRS